jgi:septum formation protein
MLILASASPRRSELLKKLGVPFDVIPSAAEETHDENLTAGEVCQINAYRKARSIAKKHPNAIVLGMDTLVADGQKLYGKPASNEEAERMLLELSGKTHRVVTAVCILQIQPYRQSLFFENTNVTFKELSREAIRRYHSKINPFDKAGGYAIQEQGDDIVEKISGSYSNVVGLPMERLERELTSFMGAPA